MFHGSGFRGGRGSPPLYSVRNKEKGVLEKGFSVESSVATKEIKNTQRYWPQQYMWHSERHSQERRTFCKNPLLKPSFSWFLIQAGPFLLIKMGVLHAVFSS